MKQHDAKDTQLAGKRAAHLGILQAHMEASVSILDAELNYEFISDSTYEQLNLSPHELRVGDNLSKCHDLMTENGLLSKDAITQQNLSAARQLMQSKDGITDHARLVRLGNGDTHRFMRKALPSGQTLSIAQNVSELVQTQNALEKIMKLGQCGYWILDLKTRRYTLSSTLGNYFGADGVARVHSLGILSVVHPDDRAKYKAALAKVGPDNRLIDVTCRTTSYKGNIRWCQTIIEVVRDAAGKPIRMEAFVKDTTRQRRVSTELEQAKDEAIAASQAKSQFLANMSHEIRTPMNGILGMAELLAHSDIGEQQRDYVKVINNSASALLTIINDILDFSKIEAGAFEIDPMPFDLKSSIADVSALLQTRAQEKGLELIINYPSSLPHGFIGDAGRLRQVITNLIGNAVKFTKEGHITIDVNVTPMQDNLSICNVQVRDTGIGIPPEKMDRIFEKFTQADGSTTRVYGGTGLGLTISKHIVEIMGGRMHVSSTFGEGSTFGFRVPLPLDPNARDETFDSTNICGKRVLIIDDIAINRELFTAQMRAWDMEPDIAVDGVEALLKLRTSQANGTPYDLILLDYLMPGMNGQELAQLIHKMPDLVTVPTIMLSSCDQPVSSQELQTIGIDSYLVKPVRERRLFDTIVRSLSPTRRSQSAQPQDALSQNEVSPKMSDANPRPRQIKAEVLVAEDFELNQDVVRLMLADTPFSPVFAKDGEAAVKLFCAQPDRFPVVLMDVSMPVMDGFTATKLIRAFEAKHSRPAVPIIALTGHALKNDRQDCLNAGMDDYLTKPVKQIALIEMLEVHTGKAIALSKFA